jgi:CubicO group peptidase (beta-lactamase class C family)
MYKIRISTLLLVFSLSLGSCSDKQGDSETEFSKTTDSYFKAFAANERFSGSAFIVQGDTVRFARSYGMANYEEGVANTDSTKYLIGSITKPFTAMAVLLLEKEGKLSLNERLHKYFPRFPRSKSVTIRDLLNHTSGIRDYHYFDDWKEDSKKDVSPYYTIKKVSKDPYDFSPGRQFRYSNTGYIFLGLIIQRVSRMSFESYIQKAILDPLDLKNTGVITNSKTVEGLANGYTTSPVEKVPAEFINYNQPFTSGNMYSTAEDLYKFTKAVFDHKLLSPEKTQEMLSKNSGSYGCGWAIRDIDGVKAYGHNGGMNGFVGSITYLPETDYFICFLTNDDNTPKYTLSKDLVSLTQGKAIEAPEKQNLMELNDEYKEIVTGEYQVKKGHTFTVFTEGSRLFLQESGNKKQELFPVDSFRYVPALLEFQIDFDNREGGKTQLLQMTGLWELDARRKRSRKNLP